MYYNFKFYYNLMGPPSYMWSVVGRNVVLRRMTLFFDAVHRVVYEELNYIKPVPSDTTPVFCYYVKRYMFRSSRSSSYVLYRILKLKIKM